MVCPDTVRVLLHRGLLSLNRRRQIELRARPPCLNWARPSASTRGHWKRDHVGPVCGGGGGVFGSAGAWVLVARRRRRACLRRSRCRIFWSRLRTGRSRRCQRAIRRPINTQAFLSASIASVDLIIVKSPISKVPVKIKKKQPAPARILLRHNPVGQASSTSSYQRWLFERAAKGPVGRSPPVHSLCGPPPSEDAGFRPPWDGRRCVVEQTSQQR